MNTYIVVMSSLSTQHPKILEFFRTNKLFTLETFLLHYIDEHTNQTAKTSVEISMEELAQMYQAQQTIMNCKKNMDKLMKEMKTVNYRIKNTPLDDMFSKHLDIQSTSFVCGKCDFSCSTKKGLVTHQRKCNNTTILENTVENTYSS